MKFKKRVVKGYAIKSVQDMQFPMEIDICYNCGSTAIGILKKTFSFVKSCEDNFLMEIYDFPEDIPQDEIYYTEEYLNNNEHKICLNCGCNIIEKAIINKNDKNELFVIYNNKKYRMDIDFEYVDFEKEI